MEWFVWVACGVGVSAYDLRPPLKWLDNSLEWVDFHSMERLETSLYSDLVHSVFESKVVS